MADLIQIDYESPEPTPRSPGVALLGLACGVVSIAVDLLFAHGSIRRHGAATFLCWFAILFVACFFGLRLSLRALKPRPVTWIPVIALALAILGTAAAALHVLAWVLFRPFY